MNAAMALVIVIAAATPARGGAERVVLHTVGNRALGFLLDAPAQVNAELCDEKSCIFVAKLQRGGELRVVVERGDEQVDEAKAMEIAEASGAPTGATRERSPAGHVLIVKAPAAGVQEVWYFVNASTGSLRVRCQAPPRLKQRCIDISKSLRAMRPASAPAAEGKSQPSSMPQSAPAPGQP